MTVRATESDAQLAKAERKDSILARSLPWSHRPFRRSCLKLFHAQVDNNYMISSGCHSTNHTRHRLVTRCINLEEQVIRIAEHRRQY